MLVKHDEILFVKVVRISQDWCSILILRRGVASSLHSTLENVFWINHTAPLDILD